MKYLWVPVWVLAAAFGVHDFWLLTWGAPVVPMQYQTFRWPAGTETATYYFQSGADVPDSATITYQGGKLSEILDKAWQLEGYEMCGVAGDSIICRRPDPGLVTPEIYSGLFSVFPDPPPGNGGGR